MCRGMLQPLVLVVEVTAEAARGAGRRGTGPTLGHTTRVGLDSSGTHGRGESPRGGLPSMPVCLGWSLRLIRPSLWVPPPPLPPPLLCPTIPQPHHPPPS